MFSLSIRSVKPDIYTQYFVTEKNSDRQDIVNKQNYG